MMAGDDWTVASASARWRRYTTLSVDVQVLTLAPGCLASKAALRGTKTSRRDAGSPTTALPAKVVGKPTNKRRGIYCRPPT